MALRVFISCVTSEFAKERTLIAQLLQDRGIIVTTQEELTLSADGFTVLRWLEDEITPVDVGDLPSWRAGRLVPTPHDCGE